MRLIDADALIEDINVWFADSYHLIDSVKERIDASPTIEQPHWIPCGERLPDGRLNKSYLVQDKDGRRAVGTYTNWGWMFAHYMNDPVAWMPLPEPARLEGE